MDIEKEALELLKENRRATQGHEYTVPSADHYPYQWLWDSCFHAIVLSHVDPEAAKKELLSLVSRQFKNGMIPHIIYWAPGILHLFNWGVEGTSSLTQPPMIAYAALRIHERHPDLSFLQAVYPALAGYYRYLLTRRDPRGHHIVSIINPDESGEDDSPRFDEPLSLPEHVTYKDHLAKRTELVDRNRECKFDAEHCMRDFFWVKDALFNSVLVENLRALSKIAQIVGHVDNEKEFSEAADSATDAMREHMFEDGAFFSTMGLELKKLRVSTWAQFAPLFAGLYKKDEAMRIVREKLLNKEEFDAPFGIRTVSKQEKSYRPYTDEYSWRGPAWIGAHWFVYRGLVRYGLINEARGIARKSRDLLMRSGFRECFNPETGEGYGAHRFTWGALVLDMIDA